MSKHYIKYCVLKYHDIIMLDIGSKFMKHMRLFWIQNIVFESSGILDPS